MKSPLCYSFRYLHLRIIRILNSKYSVRETNFNTGTIALCCVEIAGILKTDNNLFNEGHPPV